ncbi:Polysaccharide deacetylase [Labilithrix luteola]|uniref:Polysaccharide deacetylase n=1 Tax=Labilithrix luteola TaxID=1391654 RepID=A0A0K1QB61_9BACT|nr:Polysaccharide deacetylase [Labilithrix luteola]
MGINEHANGGLPRPRFARQDAEEFAAVLADQHGPGCQTTVLLDGAATKSAIAHAVTCELPHRARPADAVILYFAGLGCAEIERPGLEPSIHLVAHDTDDDRFVSTSINLVSELSAWIRRLPVSGVFLVIDASFTGEPGGRTVEGPRLRSGVRQRSIARPSLKKLPVGETCAILSACGDDEIAREAPELGHGVFTHHLLEIFSRSSSQDAALSLGAMHREVRLAVEHTSGNRQSPVLIQGPRAASPLFRVQVAGSAPRAL